MADRPRLLDLFSGAGGAARGYQRAGFHVTGVDINPQPNYCGDEFVQADALTFPFDGFDVIHASPPCQHASAGTRAQDRTRYPKLIEPTRAALKATGKPYVIENVAGSALIAPLVLCGTEFALAAVDVDGTPLELWRHRHFESNVLLSGNGGCQHGRYAAQVAGSYGGARRDKHEARHVRHGGYVPSVEVQQELLGIDWMSERGMYQSVPPAYAHHIGLQLRGYLAYGSDLHATADHDLQGVEL